MDGAADGLVPVADLTAMIESSADAIFRQDVDGAITLWNRAAQRMLGRSGSAMRGARFAEGLGESDAARWGEMLGHVQAGVRFEGVKVEVRRGTGPAVPASVSVSPAHRPDGHVEGAWVLARDLTEQVLAQRTLAESEHRVHQSELLAGTGSFVVDRSAAVMQWSAGMYAIAGLDPLDVEPTLETYLALVHPRDRASVAAAFVAALEGGTPLEQDHRIRRPDGSTAWLFIAVVPTRGPDGSVIGVAGVCQDVTQRKETEAAARAALERERAAMEELQQLNLAKEDFLATVSHELRTPLTAILGFASLLRGDAPEYADLVEPIERNAHNMHVMVERLLDYSRLEAGRVTVTPRLVPLADVLATALAQLDTALAGRPVELDVPGDLQVRADPDALERVLVNLLGNAAKYGPPDEPISVAAQRRSAPGSPPEVVVSVTDCGPGIDRAHHMAIFDRYFRAPGHNSASGTGVGLAIVRQYVELHSGRVWVESRPGAGATFRFTLPDDPRPDDPRPDDPRPDDPRPDHPRPDREPGAAS